MMKSFIPFLVFVLAFQTMQGAALRFSLVSSNPETVASPCELPAPANFILTGVTSYSISTAWDPVAGALAYDVDVYENLAGGGQIWVAGTTTTGTSATVNVPPGGSGSYDVSVAAICSDGTESSNRSWLRDVEIIIVEVIAGMTPPDCPGSSTEYDADAHIYVPWEPGKAYQFDVMRANRISRYGVIINTSNSMAVGKVDESNYSPSWVSSPYGETMNGFTVPPPLSNSKALLIKDAGQGVSEAPVYRVEYQKTQDSRLYLYFIDMAGEGYTLQFYNCQETSDRSGAPAVRDLTDQLTVQNPFSAQIRIDVSAGKIETPVDCTLFDLNGRVVLRQSASIDHTMFLPAEFLKPGFYFLQIQTPGGIRTFKVLKSF